MTTLYIPSERALEMLRRDHAQLRLEVHSLRTMLRAFRCELAEGGGGNAVAVTTEIIPGRAGDTPGGPISVQRKRLDNSSPRQFVDDGPPVDVYSWVKADSTDPDDEVDDQLWIYIEMDDHGVWWFTGQDCPPAGD